jgi:hypothetical protein
MPSSGQLRPTSTSLTDLAFQHCSKQAKTVFSDEYNAEIALYGLYQFKEVVED